MAPRVPRLKAALAALCLAPTLCAAAPIIDAALLSASAPAVVGWSNGLGNFVVGGPLDATMSSIGTLSYSTASSLLAYQSQAATFVHDGTNLTNGLVEVDTLMNVAVEGNGTASGNLLAGTLIVKAGARGIPQLGVAAGETLLMGTAIDSAAVPSPYSVALLFDLTYTIPALSFLGDFLTFQGAHQNFFNASGYNPWSVGNGAPDFGFTLDDFVATHRVPEPASIALMLAGLVGLAAIGATGRRRSRLRCGLRPA